MIEVLLQDKTQKHSTSKDVKYLHSALQTPYDTPHYIAFMVINESLHLSSRFALNI